MAPTLAARLTPRDVWLLHLLAEHRVLTTHHIARLGWPSHVPAARRLRILYQLRALDRFRPLVPDGSAPWHYVLDAPGAHLIATRLGATTEDLGFHRDHLAATAYAAQLPHTLGVADTMTTLAHHGGLHRWWSPRRCDAAWGSIVRPDAYGRLHTAYSSASNTTDAADSGTDFFVEFDTGTENLPRVVAKLDRYARLASTTGLPSLVAFVFHSPRREDTFHHRLPTTPHRTDPIARTRPVTVATTHLEALSASPAAWRIGGGPPVRRLLPQTAAPSRPVNPPAAGGGTPSLHARRMAFPAPSPTPPTRQPNALYGPATYSPATTLAPHREGGHRAR